MKKIAIEITVSEPLYESLFGINTDLELALEKMINEQPFHIDLDNIFFKMGMTAESFAGFIQILKSSYPPVPKVPPGYFIINTSTNGVCKFSDGEYFFEKGYEFGAIFSYDAALQNVDEFKRRMPEFDFEIVNLKSVIK